MAQSSTYGYLLLLFSSQHNQRRSVQIHVGFQETNLGTLFQADWCFKTILHHWEMFSKRPQEKMRETAEEWGIHYLESEAMKIATCRYSINATRYKVANLIYSTGYVFEDILENCIHILQDLVSQSGRERILWGELSLEHCLEPNRKEMWTAVRSQLQGRKGKPCCTDYCRYISPPRTKQPLELTDGNLEVREESR